MPEAYCSHKMLIDVHLATRTCSSSSTSSIYPWNIPFNRGSSINLVDLTYQNICHLPLEILFGQVGGGEAICYLGGGGVIISEDKCII